MNHFHVAAGVLRDVAGRVLIAERLCEGPYNGLWEFPGGKIRDGESPLAALCRELHEELGIDAVLLEPLMNLSHSYPDRTVTLEFFLVSKWHGAPAGREGQRIRWVAVSDLNVDELLPADAPLVAALQGSF
ncbi:MAG: 8-oxo-dGTP diphosphatase MutT [Gammaproteobacteria bacterium]|nr:8-oxo-dGTP diphosphatase MutT [Gammaproteobacteria bacterium]MDH5303438.1 8-oxo-dGTP diphosphatase MutT [Gammaproteobacteria bacterium]MDH5321825.1 8-oxo-dGTP diphosphatase MutT [Gammaproteobacteria bacterium]